MRVLNARYAYLRGRRRSGVTTAGEVDDAELDIDISEAAPAPAAMGAMYSQVQGSGAPPPWSPSVLFAEVVACWNVCITVVWFNPCFGYG